MIHLGDYELNKSIIISKTIEPNASITIEPTISKTIEQICENRIEKSQAKQLKWEQQNISSLVLTINKQN